MKRVLCLAAGFSLIATAAFGQYMSTQQGMQVTYRNTGKGDGESLALAEMLTRTLDKSRFLHLTPVLNEESMELEAPRDLVKEEGGRVTVRYEVTPPRGSGREFTASCTAAQLQRCADLIVQRVERLAREVEADRNAGRMIN